MILKTGNMGNWIIALTLAGYPLVSYIPSFLGIDSTPISILYRLVYVVLSLMVIATLTPRTKLNLNLGVIMFLVFWIVYSIRLIWDLSIADVHLYEMHDAFYFYSLAFGGALIPSIAIVIAAGSIDSGRTVSIIYTMLAMFGVLLGFLVAIGSGIPFFHNGRLFANENLNSITTGHAGASLTIISLSILLDREQVTYNKTMLYITFFGGLAIALYSGARSPLIVAAIVVSLLMLRLLFRRHLKRRIFYRWLGIALLLMTAIGFYVVPRLATGEFKVAERLSNTGGEKEVRSVVWATAVKQFLDNPIFGDQFLERSEGKYPHNILLEAPMATGIVGTIPFVLVIWAVLVKSINVFVNSVRLIPVIALLLQYFLWNLTSGSLFGSGGLWILAIWVLALPARKYYDVHKRED